MNPDAPIISLPEYDSNPFIASLPPLQSKKDVLASLAMKPIYDQKERLYPAHIRMHCIMRLEGYFEPLERQIQLAQRFDMLLRRGYVGRNPLTTDYIHRLKNGVERYEANSIDAPVKHTIRNSANSFALVGCSGNGKSTAIERLIAHYTQCISHHSPFSLQQIVWLKLECPYQGSIRQLCLNFFASVDQLVGTNYLATYASKNTSNVDRLMVQMAHIANLHGIGVLIIDEIQHLDKSSVGPEGILNFLVTLVNTIGIPVILVGTLSALPMLQDNFRQARRASGMGSLVWDPMPKNSSWEYFIKKLWQYQWTAEFSELTPAIMNTLYDQSQGIIDIVVKLFMLVQLRLVSIGETRKNTFREIITPDLIRRVVQDDLQLVQPMLHALRNKDLSALSKYDDLLPLQTYVSKKFSDALNSTSGTSEIDPTIFSTESQEQPLPPDTLNSTEVIRNALKALRIADDIIEVTIKDALAQYPSADPLLLISSITSTLSGPSKLKKSVKKAKSIETPVLELPAEDLRRIISLQASNEVSAYDALLTAGIVKIPLLDIGA